MDNATISQPKKYTKHYYFFSSIFIEKVIITSPVQLRIGREVEVKILINYSQLKMVLSISVGTNIRIIRIFE